MIRRRVSSFLVSMMGLDINPPKPTIIDTEDPPTEKPQTMREFQIETNMVRVRAGDVVIEVSLTQDKKGVEVTYVPSRASGKRNVSTSTTADGAMMRIT